MSVCNTIGGTRGLNGKLNVYHRWYMAWNV